MGSCRGTSDKVSPRLSAPAQSAALGQLMRMKDLVETNCKRKILESVNMLNRKYLCTCTIGGTGSVGAYEKDFKKVKRS